jgi:two-component system LytT family sensor kinase
MSNYQPSIRNYFVVYSMMWLVWIGLHFLILYKNGIEIFMALTDTLISNITLFVFCIVLSNILRYYQPGKNSSKYLFIWSLVLASVWYFMTKYAIIFILGKYTGFMQFFNATLILRFILANLFIGASILLMWVWQNHKNQYMENMRHMQSIQLAREAELSSLRQQLQPHFLFNSLNSISALAGSQPQQARLMIQQLSDFLRGTLKKEESSFVPLSDEISNVKLYLEIEKVRFGHRLNTDINIDDSCLELQIPHLLLQPIVENAIKYGLYDTLDPITISINARSVHNELVIEVKNPYCSDISETSKGIGFGLSSLKRRLFLLYDRPDLLKTNGDKMIFTTTLIIPQKNAKSTTH